MTTVVDNKIENNVAVHVVTTKTIAYDGMGRATQTQRLQQGVWRTMSQTYDALSRIASETFPDGDTVCYVYNTAGSLSGVGSLSGSTCNTTGVYVDGIVYNARGQKTQLTYGNGRVSDWTYHASNFRVTTKTTSGNQQNLTYGYDANGNVTAVGDSLFTASRGFTYDTLNRMITATGTFGANQSQQNCNGANGFVYNAIGNLTGKCGATLSYSDTIYHPSAVTHHSGVNKSYTYDANGNMLQRGNQTLAWTIDNRVASVSIAGGGTTYMEYDSSGMRVKKDGPNGITLYPFAGYEIDPSGVITKFIRAGGETIAAKRGTSKRFYHNDHLGGVNVITDEGGNRCQLIEYDPWGAVSRSEGTCDPDTRFTGQKLDPETGLYYYGGRYYDHEIGRFVSADPFVQAPFDPQNLNRYTYVLNNPQTLVDPTGYFHKVKKPSIWRRIFGVIAGVVVGYFTGGAGGLVATAITETAGAVAGTIASTVAGFAAGAAGAATNASISGGDIGQAALWGGITGGILGGLGSQSAIHSNPGGASPFASGIDVAVSEGGQVICIPLCKALGKAGAIGSLSAGWVRQAADDDDGPFWMPKGFRRFPYSPRYQVDPRVHRQIDERFINLSIDRVKNLLNAPGGRRFYNEDTGHYQLFRNVSGIGLDKGYLLRITVDDATVPARIISVGQEQASTVNYRIRIGQYRSAD